MADTQSSSTCQGCGSLLSPAHTSEGLCPACLLELPLSSPDARTELRDSGEAPTLPAAEAGVTEGRVHGERYRIRSLLGRGGMGEVWRAYDLKLRLDVALKSLRRELVEDPAALETLRQEVRTAREVISPNVCRVFDLEEIDGQEWISMEYVDGESLLEILRERGPLELDQAREIASQFLAGLEAIHEAGLVHRDIKPENIMVTRTGRVVVMDFGIAKSLEDGKGGMIAGTPAYMAPEQMGGDELDARTDVFAAGVVLAEMVAPGGVGSLEARRRLWEGIHASEPRIAETPWAAVIGKAVAPRRDHRFASARVLARALEEVTLRAAGDENAWPYPGLSAFTEEDARYFFGRELEVEALWKKLRRPHLLALIAPSGAGKSSFLRAGLMATLPDGWRAILATPGPRPFAALAQAFLPELADDAEAVGQLLSFEDPEVAISLVSRWRQRHEHGLIVLDQFEELFTQTPAELREGFVELIARLPLAADVHVLLAMREDFLFHCQPFEGLAPIFSELTPLGALGGSSLRRALVQPALKCGYRFEDDALVDEMVAEVSHERGALPLLAFAAAQLWEKRDRESGLITRQAYEEIGGVGGALAQHAEATLETIGEDQIPIVRELFRNLVTAQGTRAARTRDELLSVFVGAGLDPAREGASPAPTSVETAAAVLGALVDARLLTSYEVPDSENGGTPQHRIEIVHESLLTNWPRLVRWRTQDAEGAQLRDDLRQTAQRWHKKGRPEHLLWTGTSFKEFELWRERYPGGLTETEQAFADAVVELAGRTRRRRRIAIAAVFALLVAGLATVGGFWRQSEIARQNAIEEARRAEASVLVSLGRAALEQDVSEGLAYALAALELADEEPARLLALEALWRSPTALRPESTQAASAAFSPDGKWLAVANQYGRLEIFAKDGGTAAASVQAHESEVKPIEFVTREIVVSFSSADSAVKLWRVPDLEPMRTLPVEARFGFRVLPGVDGRAGIVTWEESGPVKWWAIDGQEPILLGSVEHDQQGDVSPFWDFDVAGRTLVYGDGNRILRRPLGKRGLGEAEVIGVAHDAPYGVEAGPGGHFVAVSFRDRSPGLRMWSLERPFEEIPVGAIPLGTGGYMDFSPDGSWLAVIGMGRNFYLIDMEGPPEAEPLALNRRGNVLPRDVSFSPDGQWLFTVESSGTDLWPLPKRFASVLRKQGEIWGVAVDPDGSWVAASGPLGVAKIWPAKRSAALKSRPLVDREVALTLRLAVSSDGSTIGMGSEDGRIWAIAADGSSTRSRQPFRASPTTVGFGSQALLFAAAAGRQTEDAFIHIWDLENDTTRELRPDHGSWITRVWFTPDDRQLIESSLHSLAIWNLETEERRQLAPGPVWDGQLGPGGESLVFLEGTQFQGVPRRIAIDSGEDLPIADFGVMSGLNVTRDGLLIGCTPEGRILVGGLTEGQPHLLFSHDGTAISVAVQGDRIVSGGSNDGTVRIWPMPDIDETPFHLLPYGELIAKLRALTNVRVVEDENSETGYRTEIGEFPGWEVVPTW